MKRLTALLALLAMLFALPARAELPLVYPAETVISVMRLTDAQRRLADYLYAPVLAGEEKIDLPKGTRYDDVGVAMQSLMLNYPELFHLDRTYTISYWQNEPDVAVSVSPTYRMNAWEADAIRQRLYSAALEMIAADPSPLALHDALVARASYGGSTEMRHTAPGALLEGLATCEGYAQAMTLLCRMAGVPCGIVTGTGIETWSGRPENHSWNVLELETGFTLVDATWNDQERAGLNTRWYFGLSTEQMAADHSPDSNMDVPACGDQANWHRSNGGYADTQEDVFHALLAMVNGGGAVNLRITDATLYQELAADTGALLDAYNAWCPETKQFYGRYTYLLCDAQQCLWLGPTQ